MTHRERSAGGSRGLEESGGSHGRRSGTMSEFRHPALKELTEQLAGTDKRKSLVPVAKRRTQFERAGQLFGEVDAGKNYPYPFVCFRVTGFRSDAYPDLLTRGAALRHALRLLIDRLDRSLPPLPIEQAA